MFAIAPRLFSTVVLLSALASRSSAMDLAPFPMSTTDASGGPVSLALLNPPIVDESDRVRIADGHLVRDGQRWRLWGVNLGSDAAFPDPALVDGIAARLAKFGFNCVRLHHLEAPWADTTIFGKKPWSTTRRIDPEVLDRMDRLVAAFKRHGIHTNLNLLVSREFLPADGLPPEIAKLGDKGLKKGHTIGFWDERIQALQREYAQQLLTHVNPYTGMSYASDPAIAIVEINNENSLTQPYYDGLYPQLPEVFLAPLRQRWNAWLTKRHGTAAAMVNDWTPTPQPMGRDLLPPVSAKHPWGLTEQLGAKGELTITGTVATAHISKAGTGGWTNEFVCRELAAEQGKIYTVSFALKADQERKLRLNLSLNRSPYTPVGLVKSLKATTEWVEHRYVFEAAVSDQNLRLLFTDLSQDGATFEFRDVRLQEGGSLELPAGLDPANAPIPGMDLLTDTPPAAKRDFVEFLGEVEAAYWRGMADYLAKDLQVQGIILPTIVGVSSPRQMAPYGIIDTHEYWAHPNWASGPGKTWAKDWASPRESMVTNPKAEALTKLAMKRVAGLPFLVTEYNHCPPNPCVGEGPLLLASYAALQDWDGAFLFAYIGMDASWTSGRIYLQFDIGNHPVVMTNARQAAAIFRRGLVRPAERWVTRPMPAATELDLLATVGQSWSTVNLGHLGIDPAVALMFRTGLVLPGIAGVPEHAPQPQSTATTATGDLITSDTTELTWSRQQSGSFRMDTPAAKTYIGSGVDVDFAGGYRFIRGGGDWATWSLVSDGDQLGTGRAILVAGGTAENTGMVWNQDKTSVGDQWGTAPVLIEDIAAMVNVPAPHGLRVLALDPQGQAKADIPVQLDEGIATFAIGGHGTLWYAIEWLER